MTLMGGGREVSSGWAEWTCSGGREKEERMKTEREEWVGLEKEGNGEGRKYFGPAIIKEIKLIFYFAKYLKIQ